MKDLLKAAKDLLKSLKDDSVTHEALELLAKSKKRVEESKLEKARVDEGKNLEDKVRARQKRNNRQVLDTRTPTGQKTRTGRSDYRRRKELETGDRSVLSDFDSQGRPMRERMIPAERRRGEKIVGTPRTMQTGETFQGESPTARYGVNMYSGSKAGRNMPVGGLSSESAAPTHASREGKSYRFGKYPGGTFGSHLAHRDAMYGLSRTRPNLTRSELEKARVDEGKTDAQKRGARVDDKGGHRSGYKQTFDPVRGIRARQGANEQAKESSRETLDRLKAMPKPNLPKSELEKDDSLKTQSKNYKQHQQRMKADPKYKQHVNAVEADQFKDSVVPKKYRGKELEKDDKAHQPNSPKDLAHDMAEGSKSVKQTMQQTPDKAKTASHLTGASSESWKRSPKNRIAGLEKAYTPMFQKAKSIPANEEIKPIDSEKKK